MYVYVVLYVEEGYDSSIQNVYTSRSLAKKAVISFIKERYNDTSPEYRLELLQRDDRFTNFLKERGLSDQSNPSNVGLPRWKEIEHFFVIKNDECKSFGGTLHICKELVRNEL